MSVRSRSSRDQAGLVHQIVVMVGVSVLTGALVAGLFIPFAGLLGLSAKSTADAMENLPASLQQRPQAEKSVVLAANGQKIAQFYSENRTYVSLPDIAPIMRKAIVAIEDSRFYEHGAIDLKATLRAFVANQSANGVVQGGSTITQQYVKMTLIEDAGTDPRKLAAATADTYARKFREMQLAIGVEKDLSKNQILERYLNIAYFGDGAYGIESAARHYFSTSAADLTLPEAALLAGLVKNPTGYDPTNYPRTAKSRRNVVLARMLELNVISMSAAEKAINAPIGLDVQRTNNGCVNTKAPFFCDYVRRWLLASPTLGDTPEARTHLLETGGLTIRTTINLKMQRAADKSVAKHVYPTDNAIGGLALVQPGTGAVRALAQSRPMGNRKARGETYLNYVVDRKYGDSNGFSAGSTFKVFVLATALKQGIPLTQSFYSPPVLDQSYKPYKTCSGTWADQWVVNNSTESGTMNLYTGTRLSVNTFYAQLEQKTGICQPWRLAKRMGIDNPGDQVGTFTLGVADASPLEMAEAYATFPARGVHCDSQPVTSITDRNGDPLDLPGPRCDRVMPKAVADAVNDVLRGVQEPGGFGYGAGLALNQVSAGKTGTSESNQSVWFIGYTPTLVAAAMIAGANQVGTPITLNGQTLGGTYVATGFGSTTAGPMWGDAMRAIQGMLPNKDFVPPSAQAVAGVQVSVPSLAGYSVSRAKQALVTAGFLPVVGYTVDSAQPYGTVAYTSPGAYTTAGSGSTVTIYISDGTPYVPPPPPPTPTPTPTPTNTPSPTNTPTPTNSPTPTPTPTPTNTPPSPTPSPTPTPTPPPTTPTGGGGGGGGGDG